MAAAGASGKTYSFKAVLLGEGCVGKTSLVLRYCENKFNDKHITTLQVRARWFGLSWSGYWTHVCGGLRSGPVQHRGSGVRGHLTRW